MQIEMDLMARADDQERMLQEHRHTMRGSDYAAIEARAEAYRKCAARLHEVLDRANDPLPGERESP